MINGFKAGQTFDYITLELHVDNTELDAVICQLALIASIKTAVTAAKAQFVFELEHHPHEKVILFYAYLKLERTMPRRYIKREEVDVLRATLLAMGATELAPPLQEGMTREEWDALHPPPPPPDVLQNELTINQATVETDATGFTPVDAATLAQSEQSFEQGHSLEVVTSAEANATRGGVSIAFTTPSTDRRIFSAYVMHLGEVPISVRAYVRNETAAMDGEAATYELQPATWGRVFRIMEGHAADDVLTLHILEETADSGVTFYVDACQVEKTAAAEPSEFKIPPPP